MTKKKKKELLRAQLLCALILGNTAMFGGNVANAQDFDHDYNGEITSPVDRMNILEGTVNISGNVKVTGTADLAVVVFPDANLLVNEKANKDKTIQIEGGIVVSNRGTAKVNFSNADSYLAGKKAEGTLAFSNGATWYVPGHSSAATVSAHSGNLDFWHTKPSTTRSGDAAGVGGCTLSNVGGNLNDATFIISSDIQTNKADHVTLYRVSGNNTYMIKVAYDRAISADGTYMATTAPVVLTIEKDSGDKGVNKVEPGIYTATRTEAVGLKTVNVKLTPILSPSGDDTKLVGLKVEKTPEGDGPAAVMARSASATQLSALGAWRAENNDLQRRLGDLRWDEGSAGAWVRAYGGESEINGSTSSNVSYHGIQAGYDRARAFGDGKLFTGVALSKMNGDASGSAGSSDFESNLFGVYGSYVGKRGHFIDAIIKYGRLSNDTSRTYGGVSYTGDYAAHGLNMSLEYGYRKELRDGFYLEPQAELNYGHIDGSSYTMKADGTSGAFVENNSTDSFITRVGINAGRNTRDGNVYLKLSGLHEFNGDTGMNASYNGTTVSSSSSGSDTWLEYGVGFDQRIAKDQNLYGEITRSAFADKVSDKWKANLGWRVSF